MDPTSLILFVFLVICSAFFSGTEIALMTISQHKIESFIKQRKSGAQALKKIKSKNDKLLITILIGNNLVNVGASSLATLMVISVSDKMNLPGGYSIGIATGIVTIILLLFGEITPKTLCSKYSEKIALNVAPFYSFLMDILTPITFFIELFVKFTNIFFGGGNIGAKKMSSEEFEAFIDMSHEKGAVETEEHKKIKGVLDLGDTLAESVMTPRVQMDAVNINITVDQLCEYLLIHSHSRIPIYRETIDQIDNFITFKQAFKLKESGRGPKKLSEIHLDQIIKVPLTQPIDKIFKTLQKSRKHMALVLDEYGGVEGLITIEDIIEEVFGDIKDETDKEGIYINVLREGKIIAGGTAVIEDILDDLGIKELTDIGLKEEHSGENISYIITSKLERFPENGEKLRLSGKKIYLSIEVKQVNNGKMDQIIIEKFDKKI